MAGRPPLSGNLSAIAAATRAAGFHAIDLDLTHNVIPPRWPGAALDGQWMGLRIRSCWLPPTLSGPLARRRALALLEFLRRGRDEAGLRTLVLPRSASGRGVPMATTVRELTSGTSGTHLKLAVAVDAATLAANPSQRNALQSIRRMAEEWDLEIALDLTVPTKSAWEAEAAVLRLLPRLRLVRLPCRTNDVVDSVTRVVDRTVAMLADQGFAGTFSLMPPPAPALRPHPSKSADHARREAERILARYDRIERDLAADPRLRQLPGTSEPR